MTKRSESAVALAEYRASLGLKARAAAKQMGVTHVALRSWETGTRVPGPVYREAIERWSKGAVPASGWGLSNNERAIRKRLEAAAKRPATGTEG